MKTWKMLAAALVLAGAGTATAQVLQMRPATPPPATLQKYDPQAAEIEKLKGEVKLLEAIVKDLQTKQQNTAATAAEALKQNVDQTKALNQAASNLNVVRADQDKLRVQFQNHSHYAYFAGEDSDGKQHLTWPTTTGPTEFCTPIKTDASKKPFCQTS
jgi:hypothetical protein